MAGRNRADISSAFGAVAIDVSGADQTLPGGCRGFYVGVTGNLKIDLPNATGITFSNVPVGILTVQATKVYQTGTTVASTLALY